MPRDSLGLVPLIVEPRKLVTSTIAEAADNLFVTRAQGTEFLSQKSVSALSSVFVSIMTYLLLPS